MHPKYDIDDLRDSLMEGVLPEEVSQKTKEWCISKFRLISRYVVGRQFKDEVYQDSQNTFGKFMVALSKRLNKFGFKTIGFKIVKAL